MKLVNQYIIPFSGLKDGFHDFAFEFGKEFFDEFSVLEVPDGKVIAKVVFEKKSTMMNLDVELSGSMQVQCDRCLEHFELPVKYFSQLVVKFGTDKSTETDEIWVIPPESYELDLKQYFFECIGLCIPLQKIHPEDEDEEPTCNEEMISLLDSHTAINKNDHEMDPRWNKLKNLLNNNND